MMKLKYLYKGTTLRKYCKEHNLNYDTVVKRILGKSKVNLDDLFDVE